jgi:hypothetical protein
MLSNPGVNKYQTPYVRVQTRTPSPFRQPFKLQLRQSVPVPRAVKFYNPYITAHEERIRFVRRNYTNLLPYMQKNTFNMLMLVRKAIFTTEYYNNITI